MDTNKSANGEASQKSEAESSLNTGSAQPGRRSFLLGLLNSAAAVLTLVLAVPYVRFLLGPIFAHGSKKPWFRLGPASQFSSAATPVSSFVRIKFDDGWLESSSKRPVYITQDQQGHVQVLSAVCPHLGCTVEWSGAKDQFLCPCHGSVFAPDGAHISGPSPRGMDSLPTKVESGELMVRYEDFKQLMPVKEVID